MRKNQLVSVIIPVYNEEKYIEQTLSKLNFPWIKEIIVVDDGSTDNTADIVTSYPVKFVSLSHNQGKGRAVEKGLKLATGNLLALLDGDLGVSVIELEKLVIPFREEDIDCTIGVMPIKGGGLGIVRKTAEVGLELLTGRKLKAPLSGQRVFKRELLDYIFPLAAGYGLEMGLNIDSLNNNFMIKEVECQFFHDVTGRDASGYWHRLKQLYDIIRVIINRGFSRRKRC